MISSFKELNINGSYELLLDFKEDIRGFFLKTFVASFFEKHNLPTTWTEEYFSLSNKNVLRGMHFQIPPYEVDKLVYCVSGSVLDVIIDLRKKSSTYLSVYSTVLTSQKPRLLFVPKGCAHGFLSLENNSMLFYKVSNEYSYDHDKGVLWSSINFDWPDCSNIILSERDKLHPAISDFENPF